MAQGTTIRCALVVKIRQPDGTATLRYSVRAQIPHFPANISQLTCLGYALASHFDEKILISLEHVSVENLAVIAGSKRTVNESLSDNQYETISRKDSTLVSCQRIVSPLM